MASSLKRWKEAQRAEARITPESLRRGRKRRSVRYARYWETLRDYITINSWDRILDIGSKQFSLVHFLEKGERYSLDPISSTMLYQDNGEQRGVVGHIVAVGEALPLRTESFNVITITNAIDHTYNPKEVLGEIYRVLSDDGWLILSVHTYGFTHKMYRAFNERMRRGDAFHPFTFTRKEIEQILEDIGFKVIVSENIQNPVDTVKERMLRVWYRMLFTMIDKIYDNESRIPSADTLFLCQKRIARKL